MSSLNNEAMGDDDVVEVESIGGPGVWNDNIESFLISLIEDEVKK